MLKFLIGIQACFTTFTYSSRFSSLNYRWKECHTGIILLKRYNYCSFAYSPLSTSLVRAWARQKKKKKLACTVKIWINMFSPGSYPREQSEDWSNCVDAQANQSSLGAQLFCFVVLRLESSDFGVTFRRFFPTRPPRSGVIYVAATLIYIYISRLVQMQPTSTTTPQLTFWKQKKKK